jgi:DNA-binding CsgD family transcriptional regulator
VEPQEEIVRLLAVQLRRDSESQTEAIVELGRAGFAPIRIAELMGTTGNTVNVALAKERKRRKRN